jgi:excisionase family DNA binding protein
VSALTIRECAAELGVHQSSVWRAVQVGILPALKIGRVYRIEPEAWAAFKRRLAYTPRQNAVVPFGGPHAPLIDRTRPQ